MSTKALCALPGYIGSKMKLIDFILPHLPYRGTYVEPFGGTGTILLTRLPEQLEYYNDINTALVDYLIVLQKHNAAFRDRITNTIWSREEFDWCRDTWPMCFDIVERVARWYYSMYYSYNCMGTTFHRQTKDSAAHIGKIFNRVSDLQKIGSRLKNVTISCLDWQKVLKTTDSSNTTFYIDPPYHEGDKGYYSTSMDKTAHILLLKTIFTLKGHVVLSGYNNDLYDIGWPWTNRVVCAHTTKASSRTPKTNKHRIEVLWIKEAK